MIKAVSHFHVLVSDKDAAKAFYTDKLGFEVRQDVTLDEEMGGIRWLTVGPPGQPDVNLMLMGVNPGTDERTTEQAYALVAKGALGGGILHSDDCRATCAELEARGVELTQQPQERFYGIDAGLRDPDGNHWRIVQPLQFDVEAVGRREEEAVS